MATDDIDGSTLEGVSATTLWTLYNRGTEAQRDDSLIDDPLAAELFDRIHYDYAKFGKPSQSHPLRALAFDQIIRDYAHSHPVTSVVALGEGLQTSYWRIGIPNLQWFSVDLEPVIHLREQLLPAEENITNLALSALDRSWMDEVDPDSSVVISAEGLLMYLEPDDALSLIADCAARFPGGLLIFDSIPKWFSDKTLKNMQLTDRYVTPRMPFSLSVSQAARLPQQIPGVVSARDVALPPGRGLWNTQAIPARLLGPLAGLPKIRDMRPCITELTFG